MFSKLCLSIGRLAITSWVGAAVLFVVSSVLVIRSGQFPSDDLDRLVALRFPPFYLYGVISLVVALLGILFSGPLWKQAHVRWGLICVLITTALSLMAIDYFVIFLPLLEMVTPPGQPRPQRFTELHEASKMINGAGMLVCLLAGLLANWPLPLATVKEN